MKEGTPAGVGPVHPADGVKVEAEGAALSRNPVIER